MRAYPAFFRLAFSRMDPERAHHMGLGGICLAQHLGLSSVLRPLTAPAPALATAALGRVFPSPFGLAAGFDKNGQGVDALAALGFGHIEVGTVTARAQAGNPQPRLFRLPAERALINRMGFNNEGAEAVAVRLSGVRARLEQRYGCHRPVVGINIGKTKTTPLERATEDYCASAQLLAPHADYLVVNVSSPNTPGLRSLQTRNTLTPLLEAVRQSARQAAGRPVPLLVKLAPDMTNHQLQELARMGMELELDGIICTNTTTGRGGLRTSEQQLARYGEGGLSGAPLAARSIEVLKRLRDEVGDAMALISVGGVTSGADVRERLDAGATLVQGYTAFIYEGPFWAARINRTLAQPSR